MRPKDYTFTFIIQIFSLFIQLTYTIILMFYTFFLQLFKLF